MFHDETHLTLPANTSASVQFPNAKCLGVTAVPVRGSSDELDAAFARTMNPYTRARCIELQRLAAYHTVQQHLTRDAAYRYAPFDDATLIEASTHHQITAARYATQARAILND